MNTKAEAEKLFKEFYNMVENQFQTKISILRSDNGTKFLNLTFEWVFLTQHGIQHQSIYKYTPQQNDIAKRKNFHLLEVSRALILSMNLSKYL
jgi:hypothetical protein